MTTTTETDRWMRGPLDDRAIAEGCWFDLAAAEQREHERTAAGACAKVDDLAAGLGTSL